MLQSKNNFKLKHISSTFTLLKQKGRKTLQFQNKIVILLKLKIN